VGLREIGFEDGRWIELPHFCITWLALVLRELNLQFPPSELRTAGTAVTWPRVPFVCIRPTCLPIAGVQCEKAVVTKDT
jgi:hypothetical protein